MAEQDGRNMLGNRVLSMARRMAVSVVVMAIALTEANRVSAQQDAAAPQGDGWCKTFEIWQNKVAATRALDPNACATQGLCDVSTTRDSWVPEPDRPFTVIRLYFNVICNDDGSNCATTSQRVADQVANLNADYAPSRISFEYDMRFVNASQYRSLSDAEMDPMKNLYAVKPDSQMNIFVSFVEGAYSYGTFPWDSDALTKRGGIVMTTGHFSTVQSTLAHEVGHCLGLWHTHHGVSEVPQCSGCYEKPNNLFENDLVGDFCSDTDPTPTNQSCGQPGSTDPCTGQGWGITDTWNFMGYSGEFCWSAFSTQQKGRMHCWFNEILQSWSTGVHMNGANTFGPAPLTVDFQGITAKTVNSWLWDFGDGATANVQNPSHTYAPGHFDVSVTIQATDGTYLDRAIGYVYSHADSIKGSTTNFQPNADIKVDVYARNYIPLHEILLPIEWFGPFNLVLDSVSTQGLRTADFQTQRFVTYSGGTKQAVYQIVASADNSVPDLAPGAGPILSIWFSTPVTVSLPSNTIHLDGYSSHLPTFGSPVGSYNPAFASGLVRKCRPGDVDNNDSGPDIGDLNALIDFLFVNGQLPPNPAAGDTNGDSNIDISDLQFFIDYLFFSGPAPQGC